MRLPSAIKRGLLSLIYTALALFSLQQLWPMLPSPPIAWMLLPALLTGCLVWGISHLRKRSHPEPVTGLELLLLANALTLWLVMLLQIPGATE